MNNEVVKHALFDNRTRTRKCFGRRRAAATLLPTRRVCVVCASIAVERGFAKQTTKSFSTFSFRKVRPLCFLTAALNRNEFGYSNAMPRILRFLWKLRLPGDGFARPIWDLRGKRVFSKTTEAGKQITPANRACKNDLTTFHRNSQKCGLCD